MVLGCKTRIKPGRVYIYVANIIKQNQYTQNHVPQLHEANKVHVQTLDLTVDAKTDAW
jgi:hypothetical protein